MLPTDVDGFTTLGAWERWPDAHDDTEGVGRGAGVLPSVNGHPISLKRARAVV
jgi:hypothetical protein